jgi:hypothetical protein
MKILFIGPGMGVEIPPVGWGAIEKVIWKWTIELRKRGHEIKIINRQDIKLLLSEIDAFKPDIIHGHVEWFNKALTQAGVPFIFTSHMSSWIRNWAIVGPLLKGCTMAMPFEMMGDKLYEEGHKNYWSIWNGADPEVFKPGIKIPGFALAVGRNEPRKKFGEIIKYIQGRPDMKLTIISPNVESLQSQDGLTLIPNQIEPVVAHYMGQAQYFFHLADEEADCLVVKEAAMCGCCLMLSPYCQDVFLGNKDPDSIYINSLFPETALKMSQIRYTWTTVVDNLEEGYKHYLSEVSK